MAPASFEHNPFRSHFSPSVPIESSSEREKRWVEYAVEENRVERFCLFSDPVPLPQEIEQRVNAIRKRYPDIARPVLEFFAATAWHDRANAGEAAFFGWAEQSMRQEGKRMSDLTPADVERLYATFPDRARFEGDEARARELYRASTKTAWETENFDQKDAQVHQLDLEDRAARYQLTGEDLQRRRTELLTVFERLIHDMRNSGRKSEFEVVYLIRRWAMEKNVSHLVTVQLGLPREDRASQKTDVWLIIAGIPYSLQLKTEEKDDEYRREFYQQVRAKAQAAIQGTDTKLVVLDTPTLMDAFALTVKSESRSDRNAATRAKQAIVETIVQVLPPEAASMLSLLTEQKATKSKSSEQKKRLTGDFLMSAANPALLERLGLLSSGIRSPQDILQAKKQLIQYLPVIAKIVGSQDAFQSMNDEQVKKIAAALRREEADAAAE